MGARTAAKTVRRPGRRPGVDRARAWIATAINPVLGELRSEQAWLGSIDLTWRHHRNDFERLAPIGAYVDTRYLDNLTDFADAHPEVRKLINAHDERLDELRLAAGEFYAALLRSNEFRATVLSAIATARQAGQLKAVSEPDESLMPFIAENCVNYRKSVSMAYAWADFWNDRGPTLFEQTAKQAAFAQWRRLEDARCALVRDDLRLIQTLVDLRRALADSYGLALVPLENG